jgi:hypothetical protein
LSWILVIFTALYPRPYSFIFLSSNVHRKQYMNDHHNICNMTSSISILQCLLKNSSQLIACKFESKHPQGCHFEHTYKRKPMKCCRKFKLKTSTNFWKWRKTAIGMHSDLYRQQDVVRRFNVHLLTFRQLFESFPSNKAN